MHNFRYSKQRLLLSAEQVKSMSADEIAQYVIERVGAKIIRLADGTIDRIVNSVPVFECDCCKKS